MTALRKSLVDSARSIATAAFLSLLLVFPGRSWAQSVTGMVGKAIGADPEVTNAAQAAEEELRTVVTKGKATRGASGAIAALLTESDNLICSAWIVSFRVRYRNMVIEGADAGTLRAMQNLMEKVEKACEPIMNPTGASQNAAGNNPKTPAPAPTPTPVKEKPIYPSCPECDPLKRALDEATYEHERAQWELSQAMRRTDFLEQVEKSNRSPAEKRAATGGETSTESEKFESRKRAAVDNARMRMEAARKKLVDCLDKCNRRIQGQKVSSSGGMSKGTKLALAGGAAAGVTAVALSAGGGSDSPSTSTTAVSSLPMNVPASTTTTTAPPTGSGSSTGVTSCAGSYNASFVVSSDPAGHRQFVGMPSNMSLEVAIASVHIRGSEPFVEVDGPIDSDGNFQATGMGTVAGFNNVSVTMNGTLRGCGAGSGTLQALYTMGAHGELPQGQPITYQVTGSR